MPNPSKQIFRCNLHYRSTSFWECLRKIGFLLVGFGLTSASAQTLPSKQDPRLIPAFKSNRVWNAVTTTKEGRVFVGFPGADGPGVQIQELSPGGIGKSFPSDSWNSWKLGNDPKEAFVRVNALRVGPDGFLWVVDAGAPGIGKPVVSGGPRIIKFDLSKNGVAQIYPLESATKAKSYIDDIRFNANNAYLTDAGEPGLLVLDLKTGNVRRVLDGDSSTVDGRSMFADGKLLRSEDGSELRVHADQLEVSPNGKYLYYQPASGTLSRIETRWLDDPSINSSDLASHVQRKWADTPTTGGTAVDADGTIYLSDTNAQEFSP